MIAKPPGVKLGRLLSYRFLKSIRITDKSDSAYSIGVSYFVSYKIVFVPFCLILAQFC